MLKNLVFLTIILSITRTVLSEINLQTPHSGTGEIDPLYDDTQELLNKDQDKRTIFSPTYSNYGFAKHTGITSGGKKLLLGYSAVDLKFVPVVKPLGIKHGYRYTRPKIQFRYPLPIKPSIKFNSGGWRPIAKPVVPINIASPPVHHHHKPGISIKPTDLVNHVHHIKPVQVPVPVHVHQPLPVRPAIPFHPIVAAPPVPVAHPAPVLPVAHPAPVVPVIHPAPAFPIVPAHQHVHFEPTGIAVAPAPLQPVFKPSPLFEVTKPDLGVLPFGATFQSPILSQPPVHYKPSVVVPQQIATPINPQPVIHQPVIHQPVIPQPVIPQTVIHQPVVPQHIVSQPVLPRPVALAPHPVIPQSLLPQPVAPPSSIASSTSIEFHGTYHPTPINGHIPANLLPTVPNPVQQFFSPPVNAAHPVLPTNYHNFHSNVLPQQPQDISQVFHPQVPVAPQIPETPVPQNFFHQNLPETTQHQFISQTPNAQEQIYQQQLPENTAPHYFSQSVQPLQDQQQQSYILNQQQEQGEYDNQGAIQPGQTDLQLPLHLPHHPVLGGQYQSYQDQLSQQSENVFRPSITLEPPYFNRRSSDRDESHEDYEDDENGDEKLK